MLPFVPTSGVTSSCMPISLYDTELLVVVILVISLIEDVIIGNDWEMFTSASLLCVVTIVGAESTFTF